MLKFDSKTLIFLMLSAPLLFAEGAVGDTAYNFAVPDLDRNIQRLSDYSGKVLFLVLFGHG